ncbi:hypothetical protein [Aeromonas media]|nr:hypothetical protein [Aeromonas media]
MTDQKIQNRELAGYFSYAVGQCLSVGLVAGRDRTLLMKFEQADRL